MSCCDASLVKIVNNSGTDFTVTASDGVVGNLHDLDKGTTIANQGSASGTAYSSGGTEGNCSGYVTVTTSNGSYSLTLNYAFTAANKRGSCPCTATSQDQVTSANYVATAVATTGSSDGTASTVWTITTQLT
ncbi:hypothetical protein [Stappia sp. 28M-7]|uniref:hypothetical protein n=1 Tax=Stappia sp. 28M-7 TaxID=2762596 RepID=UPI00163C6E5A|nr:hypothetical protein [Stappia sp. 28M-7]MBC2860107.1 hypothetical protein [Stappia sp. 28M-7]